MSRLADLATRRFTQQEFDDALKRNLEKKRLREQPLVEEDILAPIANSYEEPIMDEVPEAPKDLFSNEQADEESYLDKWNKHWINQRTTDAPANAALRFSKWLDPERGTKGLRSYASAFAESVGNVLADMTSPMNVAATVTGAGAAGAAYKGAHGLARNLGRATYGLSAPEIASGTRQVFTGDTTEEKVSGAIQALFGGLGVKEGLHYAGNKYMPKPAPGNVPPPPPPPSAGSLFGRTSGSGIPSKTNWWENEVPPEGPMHGPRSLDESYYDELDWINKQKEQNINEELQWIEEQKAGQQAEPAGEPPLLRSKDYEQPPQSAPDVKETPEQMSARLFPGIKRGQSKFNLGNVIKNLASGEEGSYNPGWSNRFFQGEEDLGYNVRTNDPDAVDLGNIDNQPIDLEQAALEAGSETAKPINPIMKFLQDEEGSFNPDFMNRPGTQEHSPDLMQQTDPVLGGEAPRFEPRTPSPDAPAQPSMFSRLFETMADETGSVPRRPKGSNVWANLPDNVKATFKQAGIGPKDIEGYSLKDVNDTYEAFVAENAGIEPPVRTAPDKPKPTLIKPSGERIAPLDEDAQIAKLTEDAMRAAEAERAAALKSGQTEMSPGELDTIRNRMQYGRDEMGNFDASIERARIPPLRSKDYVPGQQADVRSKAKKDLAFKDWIPPSLQKFMKDESGEIDLNAILGPNKTQGPQSQVDAIPPETKPGFVRELANLPLGLMSVDLPFLTSAAFRQASPLAWTKEWMGAWSKAAQAYGSQGAYDEIMDTIYKMPEFQAVGKSKSLAEKAGLRMSELKLTNREEVLRSTWAEKLPWVKNSNRAYSAFLNHTRAQTFKRLVDEAKAAGTINDETVLKGIGEFINDATGRGTLSFEGPGGSKLNLERSAPLVRNALWSPRLLASRLKFFNPYTYYNAPDSVRQEYIKGAFRTAGTWMAFAGLAKMAGAQVNTDPTNSDFGKIKIGDTRIDPGAGFQQFMVLAARQAPKAVGKELGFPTGRFTSSSSGKPKEYGKGAFPIDRIGVAEDFAASKLHPTYRLAYDIFRASNERPVHLGDRAIQMALPIMAQDIVDVAKSDPEFAAILGPISSVGMGTSTYGKGDRVSDPVFTDSIEKYLGKKPGSLRGTVTGW
jgi:hypothetical protein